MVKVTCVVCGTETERRLAEVNRSRKRGRREFCSLACSGIASPLAQGELESSAIRENQNKIVRYAGNRLDDHSPFREHLKRIQRRIKKTWAECDLALGDLRDLWERQEGCCALSGVPLEICRTTKQTEPKGPRTASLDRIDHSRGYVRGNVRWVSMIANYARNKWSDEDVIDFAKAVVEKNEASG